MLQPQYAESRERGEQIRRIERHEDDQQRLTRDRRIDAAAREPVHEQHGPAETAARQRLVGEELRETERDERAQRPRRAGRAERALPRRRRAYVRRELQYHREQQPVRSRVPRELAETREIADLQNDEDQSGEHHHTKPHGREPPRRSSRPWGSAPIQVTQVLRHCEVLWRTLVAEARGANT